MTIKGKIALESVVRSAEQCSRGARTFDMTVADARAFSDALFALIKGKVAEGERVHVPGFGVFERTARRARTVKHPKTGEPVSLPECWRVALRASTRAKGTR